MEKYWYYLDREKFLVRQYSIIPFLKDYETVVEIGCGKNPVSNFISNKKFVIIEPNYDVKNINNNDILHIKKEIENVNLSELKLDRFCLITFGLDWELEGNYKNLFDRSSLAIIETITDLEKHRMIIESIKSYKKPWIEYDIHVFDDEVYPEDSWPPRCNRKIMIFKNE